MKKIETSSLAKIKMDRVHHVYFVGIGGCGMSAIAKILQRKGFLVAGSDAKESSNTLRLKEMGIKVDIGHQDTNVRGADLLVVSSAIYPDNPEILEAQGRGIKICRRADMLSWIMDQFKIRVAVAGTHGKTTTTSMLSQILMHLSLDPTFLIGGETDSIEGNARLGKSDYIVAEADESDGSFLALNPNVAVITNIENDHLDYYGSLEAVIAAFHSFAEKLGKSGHLIINVDEKNAAALAAKIKDHCVVHTYGLTAVAELHAADVSFDHESTTFSVIHHGKNLGSIKLMVPGWQNVLDALAAIYIGVLYNFDFGGMAEALLAFRGAKRRFQLISDVSGIKIIDDYAHHPTEIKMTLQAARLYYPDRRIICVFQPHRYSRTLHLYKEFAQSFAAADLVIITDIYSAGEKRIAGVSGRLIMDEMLTFHKTGKENKESMFIPKKEKIVDYLLGNLKDQDLVVIAGAGDINTIAREITNRLRMKERADI